MIYNINNGFNTLSHSVGWGVNTGIDTQRFIRGGDVDLFNALSIFRSCSDWEGVVGTGLLVRTKFLRHLLMR